MSPASKSKSKEKRAIGKEPQKASGKPAVNANMGIAVPTSGYNPLLGTFHTLETAPTSSALPIHANGRFRNIDDTDDRNGGVEYDTVSNNGSWSGESEEHKEKASQGPSRQELITGADCDKREKIRQKNEKKHQRQKERRAQELHERCSGYLMSRKLEALAQKLVGMGFTLERATMALILNEGRVEESVAWLLEGGEDADNPREHNLENGRNLKIDISEELAMITEMEVKFKCSKQEVERAIVGCEGDLEQAAETLRIQKQDPPSIPPKPEETGDPPIVGSNRKPSVVVTQNSLTTSMQSKATPSVGVIPIQQKRDDKDFTYSRTMGVGGPSMESGSKSIQLQKKLQPKLEWAKQQQFVTTSAERRWPVSGSNSSASFSSVSPLLAPPPLTSKTEARYMDLGNGLKNLQLGSVKEPVIMMQRPQSKQIPTTSITPSSLSSSPVADWPTGIEPAMNMQHNGMSIPTSTRSFSPPGYGSSTSNHLYDQFYYQQQQPQLQQQHYVSTGGPVDHHPHLPGVTNHRMVCTPTPTLAAASSLGLFTGLGSNGASGTVEWSAGGFTQLDYTNIDWSLDRVPHSAGGLSRPNGMWLSLGSSSSADLNGSGRSAMRPTTAVLSNGNNGVSIGGIGTHTDGLGVLSATETSAGGSHEWSSPFEEKDLFSIPRQFVSSPSL